MFELGRPYWSALSFHAAVINENGVQQKNELDGGAEWHLLTNDAFRSAHYGVRLIVFVALPGRLAPRS